MDDVPLVYGSLNAVASLLLKHQGLSTAHATAAAQHPTAARLVPERTHQSFSRAAALLQHGQKNLTDEP